MNDVIKSTTYCDLLKQGKVENGNSVYAIEEIFVKELKRKEIRFTYYKKDIDGKENFVARPLDLEEEHLFELIKEGINARILDKEKLINVLNDL